MPWQYRQPPSLVYSSFSWKATIPQLAFRNKSTIILLRMTSLELPQGDSSRGNSVDSNVNKPLALIPAT